MGKRLQANYNLAENNYFPKIKYQQSIIYLAGILIGISYLCFSIIAGVNKNSQPLKNPPENLIIIIGSVCVWLEGWGARKTVILINI